MSRLRRSRQHRVSILSAYLVHPFASSRHFPSRGNESVTGLAFCVIWHDNHSGDWLTAFAPLSGCAGLLHGKACHTILRSLCSLTNRVPLPPHPGDRINRSMLSCRDMAPWLSIHSATTKWWHQRKKRISSGEARLACFSPGESPVVRFYHKRAPSINLEAPPQPSRWRRVKL